MITPRYVRVMAAYNAEMNRRLYAAAARMPDAQRRADGGLFWGSLHATLNHLMWGDNMWMSRFDGWERPAGSGKDSPRLFDRFEDLAAARAAADVRIEAWAGRVTQADIDAHLTWRSGITQSEHSKPMSFVIVHFFNHQTHHRGQAHALITRHGDDIGDTDMPWVVAEEYLDGL